jgi:hypothetical protein
MIKLEVCLEKWTQQVMHWICLLVLFSQHLKPEKALNNYLCSGILELEAMVLFGMAYGRWIVVYNSKVIYYK